MKNLIAVGKTMNIFKSDTWLIYHDAGAICYFSDWNTYETMGLTNRKVALREESSDEIYARANAEMVLQNFDLATEESKNNLKATSQELEHFGFAYIGAVPLLVERGEREFVLGVFSRNESRARKIIESSVVHPDIGANPLFPLYRALRRIVKGT
jgi:hypothetical protein